MSRVLLATEVAKTVVLPFADQIAALRITQQPSKFDPVTVSVRSGLPAGALVGEIEVIDAADTPDVAGGV